MKQWLPIQGDFSEEQGKIVFWGGVTETAAQNTEGVVQGGKFGLLLFEDMIANGEIEAVIEFESFVEWEEAQIIFNYSDEKDFMCTGIANNRARYEMKSFNGHWNFLKFSGFCDEVKEAGKVSYHLRVRIEGSTVELYINNIKATSATVNTPISKTNVGLWLRSRSKITIESFQTSFRKSSAFIVSQFGGEYDVLYTDVIKPICEGMNIEPIRVDEMATCTMILDDIIASIKNAAVVIADISPNNPNVFYEVGYAHAINKPTILLCEKGCREKLPFDLSGFRTVFYDNSIGGKKQVEERLKDHLSNLNLK